LEDYGHLPVELQQQVIAEVDRAVARGSLKTNQVLQHLGIPRSSYFRWKKEKAWQRERTQPVPPVQAFEALPEEKQAVVNYALDHPGVRHRELAWKMIDEDVAYLSMSTVYRILRSEELMCLRRGRQKRYREEIEKASRPDEIWATDLMYLKVGGDQFYLVNFIDEYSRYLVHWELLTSMDGHSISVAAQRAIESLHLDQQGKATVQPIIRSDNGSGYISKEFGGLLAHHELTHHRIKPHCPEENGVMERCNRTIREAIEEHDLIGRYDSEATIEKIINHYNNERLHSALGFQTPATWYRGNPDEVSAARRLKLSQARHRRKQFNLGIRQRTLPLEVTESAN
jgi:putative transposase